MGRVFYRIVRSNPPTLDDFKSYRALETELPDDDPETRRLSEGISVNSTLQQAANRARRMPWLGNFVAELVIPDDSPITFERTGSQRGHHTLWGDPTTLRACVARVLPTGPWTGSRGEE